ncbi:MAG: putative Ig domain-containing protein, partial [Planctomycetes bacterium]|nr:putative Ig domain-containing protein [Planctomycetota bacterium]
MLNKTKLSTALVISLAILCVFAVNSLAFADPITITTNSPLPSGQVNSAYNTQINAANGTLFDCWGYDEFEPPYIGSGYVWELTAGSLPPGLSLTTTNGGPGYGWWDQADNFYTSLYPGQAKLVGTPTQAGTYNFTLRAKGYPNDPVTKEFSLTINGQPLNITTSSMPDGEVNYAYTKTLTAVGGATPYTWSVLTGSLPGGLNLNSSTGVISGTPTASGTGNFTVKAVSNDSQEDTQSLSIYIAPALSITTQSPLPSATLSGTYNTTINSTGGILYDCWGYDEYEPPYIGSGYRVSIISGTLPAGLSLTTSNGGPGYGWWDQADTFYTNEPYPGQAKLVGTPAQYGTFLFTLQIRDYLGVIVTRDYSLTVAIPQLNITTASLPDGEVNHPYSAGLNYSGGLPPYTWSILSGSLPAGLNLNSSTGAITGTPESNGTANFTIKVISNDSQEDTQPLSIYIAPALVITTQSPLNSATINIAYNNTLSATGGILYDCWGYDEYEPPYICSGYRFSIISGTLPAGISLISTNGGPGYGWWDQADTFYSSDPYPGLPKLSGTPTVTGVYNATLRLSDFPGAQPTLDFSLTVNYAFNITTQSLPYSHKNVPYAVALSASGAPAPYTWTIVSGSLPEGITLNSSTGLLSGTPTVTGTYYITFQVAGLDPVLNPIAQKQLLLDARDTWDNLTGGDHQGADWTITANTTIGGEHFNVGDFTVNQGVTVEFQTGSGREVQAQGDIVINGILKSTSRGVINLKTDGNITIGVNGKIDLTDSNLNGIEDPTLTNGLDAPDYEKGGGGGGYGGTGGAGGGNPNSGGAARGTAYFDDIAQGSDGGSVVPPGPADPYGGKGGVCLLYAAQTILVQGIIDASGTDGEDGIQVDDLFTGGAGGGSGGGILFRAYRIAVTGKIYADGGNGGVPAPYSAMNGGGGASGGRVKFFAAFMEYNYNESNPNDPNNNIYVRGGSAGSSSAQPGQAGTFFAKPMQALPRNQVYEGVGVNPYLGNLTLSLPMSVKGKVVPLIMPSLPNCNTDDGITRLFALTYMSTGNPSSMGALGAYWSHSYEIWLDPTPINGDILYNHDNRSDRFTKNPDNSYTAPAGLYAKLEKQQDGTYILTGRFGDKRYFDALGRLTRWESPSGTFLVFQYNNSSYPCYPTDITDNWGRALQLVYYSNGLLYHVIEVYANRTWELGFNAKHCFNLLTIPGGKTIPIAYLSEGQNNQGTLSNADYLVESMKDHAGQTFLTNTYEQSTLSVNLGKPIQQTLGHGGVYHISYGVDANGQYAEVLDMNGNLRKEYFNTSGFMTSIRQYTNPNLRPEEPEFYATTFTCNANYETTGVFFPMGNSIVNAFDTTNSDPLARGNLLSSTQKPIPGAGAPPDIIESMTYESRFQRLKTYTNPLQKTSTLFYEWEEATEGDLNNDGITDRSTDKTVKLVCPVVTLGLAAQGGNQTRDLLFRWNSSGQPTGSTDPDGFMNAIDYYTDATRKGFLWKSILDSATGGKQITSSQDYNSAGDVVSSTDAKGNTTGYQVSTLGLMEQINPPAPFTNKYRKMFHYNDNGVMDYLDIENTDNPAGTPDEYNMQWIRTSFIRGVMDNLTSYIQQVSATQNITTGIGYDPCLNADLLTKPEGNQVKKSFDERGLPWETIYGYGTSIWGSYKNYYDANGNHVKTVDPRGYENTTLRDKFGRYVGSIDALGNRTDIELNACGSTLSVTRKNSAGVILSVTKYLRDEAERVYETQVWKGNPLTQQPPSQGEWSTTQYKFNKRSLVELVRDALNHDSITEYDALGRPIKTQDAKGNMVELTLDANSNPEVMVETEILNSPSQEYTTTNVFDELDRLKSTTRTGDNATRQFGYNSRNDMVSLIDAEGNTSYSIVDGLSRLRKTLQDLRVGGKGTGNIIDTIVTMQEWDDNSRRTSMTDDKGNISSWIYDARDRQTDEYLPGGIHTNWQYDLANNVTQKTDPNGSVIVQTFNAVNMITGRTITRATGVIGTTWEEFAYNGAYQMTQARNDDSTVNMKYNSFGLTTEEEQILGAYSGIVSSGYNIVGKQTGLTYPSGKALTFV